MIGLIFTCISLCLTSLVIPSYGVMPCKCVAFRLEDVQDFFNTQQQETIIDTFVGTHTKLTIGVIGGNIGRDFQFVSDLQNASTTQYLEFANHGYNHERFTQFSEKDQAGLLVKTDKIMHDLFGKMPVTFIPPFDEFNNDTVIAMHEANLSVISAFDWSDTIKFDSANRAMHIPGNVEFSDYDESTHSWIDIPENIMEANMTTAVARDGYAILAMHPNNYDANIQKITDIITFVKQSGYEIETVSEIANYYSHSVPIYIQEYPYKETDNPLIIIGLGLSMTIIFMTDRMNKKRNNVRKPNQIN